MIIAVASLIAADYSQMTMEELNALKGPLSVEERAETQSRLQAMTPEERQAYIKNRENILK